MGRCLKKWVIFFSVIFAISLMIELEYAAGQQYFTYVGRVVSIQRGVISVEADNGNVMHFAVERKTIYIPSRLPVIGERVQVQYFFQRGKNVAYQVKVVPHKT
jgi:hypothetical protein